MTSLAALVFVTSPATAQPQTPASAQAQAPPQPPAQRANLPGKAPPKLEIDDCPVRDPALTDEQLRQRGAEHYTRGETLYLQGDYLGAVEELVASYCTIPYFSLLKDIGQAFERKLDYERAIAYLERYVRDIPPNATRASQCAADPQEDKESVSRRVHVLRELKAHILVQTQPSAASITIENAARITTRGRSGEEMLVIGDTYQMTVEAPGFEPVTRTIEAHIGKPYTYFFELTPLQGQVSVQVTPADARIFVDKRLVGFGRYDAKLPAKTYEIMTERQGRITERRNVEVLPNQIKRVQVELTPTPQYGRRQLIGFSTIAGTVTTGFLLFAFDDTQLSGIGSLGGAVAGFAGSYFYLPDDVTLGTSNLTITSSLAGMLIGASTALVFTDDQRIVQPVTGAAALIGAGAGYYAGDRTKIRPGDAALINTSMLWGTTAGGLFALSFAPPREVAAGLVLSGMGMGAISGVIMTRYFDISRTHAVLIDVGGIVGILGGLALESIAYPTAPAQQGQDVDEVQREHLANFALGGMAVGLIGAGILTRNLDDAKIAIQPSIGSVNGADGKLTTTYGFHGSF